MPRVSDLAGGEVELHHIGSFWASLKNNCDNRSDKDTRSELEPGRVPELRWRWVIALAMVDDWQLTIGEVSRLFKCNKGNASRMIRKTRRILRANATELMQNQASQRMQRKSRKEHDVRQNVDEPYSDTDQLL